MNPASRNRKALILGISGQDGAYLAQLLVSKGYEVHGSSRAVERMTTTGLDFLGLRDRVVLHSAPLTEAASARRLIETVAPDELYMLSGQSSVGRSFSCPAETFESIAVATLNVLAALHESGLNARMFNTASTDSFGHCERPANEQTPFNPQSPYGAAKVAAFEVARSYRQSLCMFVASGILSNHESPLRPRQFVTTKIIEAVVRISRGSGERLKLGNVSVMRDWGWAPDYVEAYWRMLQTPEPADYIIATGETNSLEDFVREAFAVAGLDWREHVDFDAGLLRSSEFLATKVDTRKAKCELGWTASYTMRAVIHGLYAARLKEPARN